LPLTLYYTRYYSILLTESQALFTIYP